MQVSRQIVLHILAAAKRFCPPDRDDLVRKLETIGRLYTELSFDNLATDDIKSALRELHHTVTKKAPVEELEKKIDSLHTLELDLYHQYNTTVPKNFVEEYSEYIKRAQELALYAHALGFNSTLVGLDDEFQICEYEHLTLSPIGVRTKVVREAFHRLWSLKKALKKLTYSTIESASGDYKKVIQVALALVTHPEEFSQADATTIKLLVHSLDTEYISTIILDAIEKYVRLIPNSSTPQGHSQLYKAIQES